MSLSCPYPCPYTYLSAHLSTTHLQSYDMTICFLWASASFDADHRGKSSLVHGTSVPRQKLTMEYGPIVLLYLPPSFQWLVSDGVSCTCLTIWTALGMGRGWPHLIMFMYRASNQYVKNCSHHLVMLRLLMPVSKRGLPSSLLSEMCHTRRPHW